MTVFGLLVVWGVIIVQGGEVATPVDFMMRLAVLEVPLVAHQMVLRRRLFVRAFSADYLQPCAE